MSANLPIVQEAPTQKHTGQHNPTDSMSTSLDTFASTAVTM